MHLLISCLSFLAILSKHTDAHKNTHLRGIRLKYPFTKLIISGIRMEIEMVNPLQTGGEIRAGERAFSPTPGKPAQINSSICDAIFDLHNELKHTE
jgi:hypothetical protein